ncbi:MAG TPA: hypothetical protein VN915_05620 [Elusimicrobiota bacterium]|nr:hypothetical protein [Elusimicrobiota bacterium]
MMINGASRVRGLAAGLALLLSPALGAAREARAGAAASPEVVVGIWPESHRATARALIEKYGRPEQYDSHALAWFNNGIWKRTIVYRVGPIPGPNRDKQFLQQTVGYIVPADKVAALKKFDKRLEVSQTAGEMTFTSDREATNLLALNLADEIVTGKRTVASARAFFMRTTVLAAAGKSSPYRRDLRFDVDNSRYMTPGGADR